MKKILLCTRMAHNNSYVGGVVSVVQSYLGNNIKFQKNGCTLDIFDFQIDPRREFKNTKINNVVYGILQRRALGKRLKKDSAVLLNIHTSREFLFLKDVLLAKMTNQKYGIPVVLTIHVGKADTVFNRIGRFQKTVINILNRHVSKIIFLSEEIRKEFINLGVNQERCEVLYNFHNLVPVTKENVILSETQGLNLLYVGAIHREKGIIELLTALNELNDMDFHIDICGKVTDSSIKNEFNSFVSSLGEKACMRGYVSGEGKAAIFQRADVLLLPSYHEGLPLVILEALAAGCAVIATPVGATPEILNDDNAIWVPVKDSAAIKKAIELLYQNPSKLSTYQKANLTLSKRFGMDSHIEKLCKIFNEIHR